MHERPTAHMASETVRRSTPTSTTPFLCRMFNWSLENGIVPSIFKSAYITQLLKKADLDPAEPKSFRPISNLSVISELLERPVSKQLLRYLKDNDLLPDLESAYRAHHSTETAILRVLSDIFPSSIQMLVQYCQRWIPET